MANVNIIQQEPIYQVTLNKTELYILVLLLERNDNLEIKMGSTPEATKRITETYDKMQNALRNAHDRI